MSQAPNEYSDSPALELPLPCEQWRAWQIDKVAKFAGRLLLHAITETWISLEEEDSDDDNCEGDLFEEEKNDKDEDTDLESEEEIEEIFELF